MSRFSGRVAIFQSAARRALAAPFSPSSKAWPDSPRRILIAHRLLLGDTIMLTPLLKKLRTRYPGAELVLTMQRALLPLYATRPYNVRALPFEPSDPATVRAIIGAGPFDVALVPGDNRHSWLAYAAGARYIVAHAGDVPAWKNMPLNASVQYRPRAAAWADMTADLCPGPAPAPYSAAEWPAPPCRSFAVPSSPFAVLHVGASYLLKQWPAEQWRKLAAALTEHEIQVVWSAGPNETDLIRAVDPKGQFASYAGQLDLAQLWRLAQAARLLVCPDTGVAHMARLIDVRTVALFGPGSAVLVGAGEFWQDARFVAVTEEDFPCRDQHILFRRRIDWVQRCERRPPACMHARCMDRITAERVLSAAQEKQWLN